MEKFSFKQKFHQNFGLKILKSSVFIILFIYVLKFVSCTKIQFDSIHKTKEAVDKIPDLFCYSCDYMDHGENCENVNRTSNQNNFTKKCQPEDGLCMVKKFSYTVSSTHHDQFSTSEKKLWSLQRNCTSRCEPGCIVIGERTKLYACTMCCNSSLCNSGSGSESTRSIPALIPLILIELLAIVFIFPLIDFSKN